MSRSDGAHEPQAADSQHLGSLLLQGHDPFDHPEAQPGDRFALERADLGILVAQQAEQQAAIIRLVQDNQRVLADLLRRNNLHAAFPSEGRPPGAGRSDEDRARESSGDRGRTPSHPHQSSQDRLSDARSRSPRQGGAPAVPAQAGTERNQPRIPNAVLEKLKPFQNKLVQSISRSVKADARLEK